MNGRGRPKKPAPERFWSKVDQSSGCWTWQGAPNNDGYGRLKVDGRNILAHRFSWRLHGLELADHESLDHACHQRMCVRPDHLRIASQSENNQNFVGAQKRNPTATRGVTRTRNGRPFKALVVHEGQHYYLGRFDDLKSADAAVIRKRLELFTHNENDKTKAATMPGDRLQKNPYQGELL